MCACVIACRSERELRQQGYFRPHPPQEPSPVSVHLIAPAPCALCVRCVCVSPHACASGERGHAFRVWTLFAYVFCTCVCSVIGRVTACMQGPSVYGGGYRARDAAPRMSLSPPIPEHSPLLHEGDTLTSQFKPPSAPPARRPHPGVRACACVCVCVCVCVCLCLRA